MEHRFVVVSVMNTIGQMSLSLIAINALSLRHQKKQQQQQQR